MIYKPKLTNFEGRGYQVAGKQLTRSLQTAWLSAEMV